jgi:hypothetical protein
MTRNRIPTALRLSSIGLVLSLMGLTAQAQTSPWSVGISQRFEHQSNVFQSANAVSDTVSTTSLVGGVDLPIGRQRVFGRASFGHVRFGDQSQLNHDGYSLLAGVNWETAGNLSGTVSIDSSRSLAEFTPAGLNGVTTNNLTRTDGGRFSVRLGGVSRLAIEVTGATRRTRFDNPAFLNRNSNIDEASAGVRYRPAGSLVLGAAVRLTRGEYPNFRNPSAGRFTPEGFEKDNLDLTAEWPISGASRVDARLSFGRDRYDTITSRNFSGATGEVAWRWSPTGRTTLTTSFSRRSGDEVSVATGAGQIPYATAATRIANTVAVVADHELTGKIRARAGLSYLDGSSVDLLFGSSTSEAVTGALLGVTWEATRAIRAGCDLNYRSRASRAGVVGYDTRVIGCFGEFVIR